MPYEELDELYQLLRKFERECAGHSLSSIQSAIEIVDGVLTEREEKYHVIH